MASNARATQTILHHLIKACKLFLITGACLALGFALLSWFHDSWSTGSQVLAFLEPLFVLAIQLGNSCGNLLNSPTIVQAFLLVVTFLALLAIVFHRTYQAVPFITGFVILLSVPLQAAGNITFYYSTAAAVLFLLTCFTFVDKKTPASDHPAGRASHLALFFILFLAVVFRFYMLDSLPPGISDEDAGIALSMKQYVNNDHNVIKDHFFLDTPLSYIGNLATILSVFFFKLFGFTPLSYRMLPASAGVLAVLALFFLTRRLFGWKPALFAAFFMAVSPWHIFYSRTNFPQNGLTVLHSILTYYVLAAALEKQKLHLWALLGILMGFSMYVYEPGKVTLGATGLIILLFFLGDAYRETSSRKILALTGKGLIILIFLLITILPYLNWGLKEKSYFYSAAGAVNLKKAFWASEKASPGTINHLSTNLKNLPVMLAFSRLSPPKSFTTSRYSHAEKGLMDFFTLGFMVLGLAFSLGHIRKRSYFILLLWGATALMPALFTAVLPKRLTLLLPVICIWAGLGANQVHAAFSSLVPKIRYKQGIQLVFVVLLALFSCYQFRDFFEKTPYNQSLHPAYSTHRNSLLKARKDSDFYTDVSNSIFNFILVDHPQISRQQDLSRNILSILATSRVSDKDLTIVAAPDVPGNRPMVTALRELFIEANFLDTKDFLLLTIGRRQLDSFYGFSAPEKTLSPGKEKLHQFRGSLVVPVAGFYTFDQTHIFNSVVIDGEIFSTSQGIKPSSYRWLEAGSHEISLLQQAATTPRLQWRLQRQNVGELQLPFICAAQFSEIDLFRSAPTRPTKLRFETTRKIQLDPKGAFTRPVDLQVGPNGNFYITDAVNALVSIIGPDGRALAKTSLKPWTPQAAIPSASGGMYVLLPWSGKGLLHFDANGLKTHTFPLNGEDMLLSKNGEILLLRGSSLTWYDLNLDGKPLLKSKYTLPGSIPSKIVAAVLEPNNVVRLLSDEPKLYTLDNNLNVDDSVALDAQTVSSNSRLAVDFAGRFYITDPFNNKIHVFDPEGNRLLGSSVLNNCPISISSPIDLIFQDKQLYVLNKEHRTFNVVVIDIVE